MIYFISKVEGEELKKELQDQQHLLAEAARAIQSLEEKYKHQVEIFNP